MEGDRTLMSGMVDTVGAAKYHPGSHEAHGSHMEVTA